jgi:NAD(P)-dependent dehydrogenase (short-subunit alcohol dehydrogenase family)
VTGPAPAGGSLTGTVAVVTGGNRGIGLGIARALGRAGARVSLWARDERQNQVAVAELRSAGITASAVVCDVTDEASVSAATARTLDESGRIDSCVANAGGGTHRPLLQTSLAEWDSGIRLNLTAAFLTFREVGKALVEADRGGALVAVSSCSALHSAPSMADYAAAKAGLGGLVRSAAAELAPYRIRVNALMPGFTANSRMGPGTVSEAMGVEVLSSIPVGRWGTPDDLGRAAVFLCDPSFGYHTGTELRVDGGYSIAAPYLAVRASRAMTGPRAGD